jgi:hypothetical protein
VAVLERGRVRRRVAEAADGLVTAVSLDEPVPWDAPREGVVDEELLANERRQLSVEAEERSHCLAGSHCLVVVAGERPPGEHWAEEPP